MTRSFPRCLLRRPAERATGRVFCFPYSGVGASMFNLWPRWLGDVEVCPLQLPARENRMDEPHHGSYQALAADLVEPLAPYLDRPTVLFGHCAGALPAFETAARLAAAGLPTPRLVVSAQVAPHHCPHDRFLDLDDEQLRTALEGVLILRGGTVHPPLVDLTMDVLRQDLDVNRSYRRARPLPLPTDVTVLHWSSDTEVTAEQLRGWQEYAPDVRFVELDGGHYEFLSAPAALLELLTDLAADRPARTGS